MLEVGLLAIGHNDLAAHIRMKTANIRVRACAQKAMHPRRTGVDRTGIERAARRGDRMRFGIVIHERDRLVGPSAKQLRPVEEILDVNDRYVAKVIRPLVPLIKENGYVADSDSPGTSRNVLAVVKRRDRSVVCNVNRPRTSNKGSCTVATDPA